MLMRMRTGDAGECGAGECDVECVCCRVCDDVCVCCRVYDVVSMMS